MVDFKNAGILRGFKDEGFKSLIDLKEAEYSAKELKDDGYSAKELEAAGYSKDALKDAGFTFSERWFHL